MGENMDLVKNDELAVVYDDLRKIAANLLSVEAPGKSTQPTSLVNAAVVRLLGGATAFEPANREHLVRVLRKKMRQILIDHSRRIRREKHGGDRRCKLLDWVVEDLAARNIDPTGVYAALDTLAAEDPRAAKAVELCHICGYSRAEAAELLDVSLGTVEKDLKYGRRRLRQIMSDEGVGDEQRQTEPA